MDRVIVVVMVFAYTANHFPAFITQFSDCSR